MAHTFSGRIRAHILICTQEHIRSPVFTEGWSLVYQYLHEPHIRKQTCLQCGIRMSEVQRNFNTAKEANCAWMEHAKQNICSDRLEPKRKWYHHKGSNKIHTFVNLKSVHCHDYDVTETAPQSEACRITRIA